MVRRSVTLAKEEDTEELEDDFDDTCFRCDVPYHSRKENRRRGNWPLGVMGTLALLGGVLGTTSFLMVPSHVYTYGSSFLIPYCTFFLLLAFPVWYLEASLGQFSSSGVLTCWVIPIFKGVGFAILVWNIPAAILRSAETSTSLFYLHESIKSSLYNTSLPWESFETVEAVAPECVSQEQRPFPEELYHICHVHGSVPSSGDPDEYRSPVNTPFVLTLLIVWTVICIISCFGVTSIACVSSVLVPIIIVTLVVLVGLTSDRSSGLDDLWKKHGLGSRRILPMIGSALYCAFANVLETIGIVITYTSFNRFHNDFTRDILSVSLLKLAVDILATVFLQGLVSLKDGEDESRLLNLESRYFVGVPDGVCYAITFFIVLFLVRLLNLVAVLETVLTAVSDQCRSFRRYRPLWVLLACVSLFLLTVPMATSCGLYLKHIVDKNLLSWLPCLLLLLILCCFLAYAILTYFRHRHDVAAMTQWNLWCIPSLYVWLYCSLTGIVIAPLFLAGDLFHIVRTNLSSSLHPAAHTPWWAAQHIENALMALPFVVLCLTLFVQLVRSLVYKKPEWKTLVGVLSSWNPQLDMHWVRVMRYRQMNPYSTNRYKGWREYSRTYTTSNDRLIEQEPETLPLEDDYCTKQDYVPFYI